MPAPMGWRWLRNYNTRPRPAEVLVDGKSAKLIRRRETAADLMRLEAVSGEHSRSQWQLALSISAVDRCSTRRETPVAPIGMYVG